MKQRSNFEANLVRRVAKKNDLLIEKKWNFQRNLDVNGASPQIISRLRL